MRNYFANLCSAFLFAQKLTSAFLFRVCGDCKYLHLHFSLRKNLHLQLSFVLVTSAFLFAVRWRQTDGGCVGQGTAVQQISVHGLETARTAMNEYIYIKTLSLIRGEKDFRKSVLNIARKSPKSKSDLPHQVPSTHGECTQPLPPPLYAAPPCRRRPRTTTPPARPSPVRRPSVARPVARHRGLDCLDKIFAQ